MNAEDPRRRSRRASNGNGLPPSHHPPGERQRLSRSVMQLDPPPGSQPTGSGSRRLGHVPALDGLRACAVIGVMLAHAEVPHAFAGQIGVYVFFCLSGFLITSLLLEEFDRSGEISLRQFWVRRALRLLPALALTVVAITLYAVLLAPRPEAHNDLSSTAWALTYTANWGRALFGYGLFDYGHTWSLAVEEQFYLIWPLVVVWVLRRMARPQRALVVIAAALSAFALLDRMVFYTLSNNVFRIEGTDMVADHLLLGCALAVFLRAVRRSAKFESRLAGRVRQLMRLAPGVAVVAALGVLFVPSSAFSRTARHGIYSVVLSGIAVGSCLVIAHLVLSPGSRLARLLACKPMVAIGRVSYGLYLFSYPIFRIMRAHSGMGNGPLLWTAEFVLAGTAAALSYALVERPVLRLKARFRGARPSLAPVHAEPVPAS